MIEPSLLTISMGNGFFPNDSALLPLTTLMHNWYWSFKTCGLIPKTKYSPALGQYPIARSFNFMTDPKNKCTEVLNRWTWVIEKHACTGVKGKMIVFVRVCGKKWVFQASKGSILTCLCLYLHPTYSPVLSVFSCWWGTGNAKLIGKKWWTNEQTDRPTMHMLDPSYACRCMG